MSMSERSQKIIVWWAIVFALIYGLSLLLLLHMVPPPSPKLSAVGVAHWYAVRHTRIEIGAVICSWTSAFMVPWACVIGVQMWRHERGGRIWSIMSISGGVMMSIFLVLPPLFFGVAGYLSTRSPQATSLMHELGVLTLVTTDQFYIFMWVAVIVMCFTRTEVKHSPFSHWFGYFTAWIALMFEAGAFAFLFKGGPLAWNGVLVFWFPLGLFSIWLAVASYLLLHNLNLQIAEQAGAEVTAPAAAPEPLAAQPPVMPTA